MKTLFCIKDDSANQVVSLYFVAQSSIEAIRQFKGFLENGKYPAYPKELSLYEVCDITEDGCLVQINEFVSHVSDSDNSYSRFDLISVCSGDKIEEAYIEFSRMNKEDFDRLEIQHDVKESDFDEEIKNGDFRR